MGSRQLCGSQQEIQLHGASNTLTLLLVQTASHPGGLGGWARPSAGRRQGPGLVPGATLGAPGPKSRPSCPFWYVVAVMQALDVGNLPQEHVSALVTPSNRASIITQSVFNTCSSNS